MPLDFCQDWKFLSATLNIELTKWFFEMWLFENLQIERKSTWTWYWLASYIEYWIASWFILYPANCVIRIREIICYHIYLHTVKTVLQNPNAYMCIYLFLSSFDARGRSQCWDETLREEHSGDTSVTEPIFMITVTAQKSYVN